MDGLLVTAFVWLAVLTVLFFQGARRVAAWWVAGREAGKLVRDAEAYANAGKDQ